MSSRFPKMAPWRRRGAIAAPSRRPRETQIFNDEMDSGTIWAWTMGRTIIPFVSTDRYDSKEMFSYLGHELGPHRRFPHATQTSTRDSRFHVVWERISNFYCSKRNFMELRVEVWVVWGNLLWGSSSWSRYVNISLGPYLSEDTNGMIVRPVVQAQLLPESLSSLKIWVSLRRHKCAAAAPRWRRGENWNLITRRRKSPDMFILYQNKVQWKVVQNIKVLTSPDA